MCGAEGCAALAPGSGRPRPCGVSGTGSARRLLIGIGFAALGVACSAPPVSDPPGDEVVFVNARIWTQAADPARYRADALAARGGRIVAVGSTQAARAAVSPAAGVVDLGGATVLPGFVDAHVHLLWIGERLLRRPDGTPLVADLSRSRTAAEAARLAASLAHAAAHETWVLGYGWSQEAWPGRQLPSTADLDAALALQPALLMRSDWHAVWINSQALRLAGIGRLTPDPPGGRILRSARAGRPAGVLIDRAIEPVARLVPRLSADQKRHAYRLAAQACLAAGITSVQVAGGLNRAGAVWEAAEEEEDRRILRGLVEEEGLPLRVSWMALGPGQGAERLLERGPERGAAGGAWDEGAIKVFMDGALGSRGAALLDDYADEPGWRGILRTDAPALEELARRALERGVQVCAHAIGSRAVRAALDAFEKAAGEDKTKLERARFRIEHASAIHPDDLPRFGALGVIASVQPAFIAPDAEGRTMEESRLGAAAPERIYALRSLLASGARLCGSTDAGAPEALSILTGVEAAVGRGGFRPAERLRMPEALALFTRESARAAFLEERAGTLEVGKLADFVVLGADPMSVPSESVGEIEILATVVGGRIVHGSERLTASARAAP